jgi:hypothetical protein
MGRAPGIPPRRATFRERAAAALVLCRGFGQTENMLRISPILIAFAVLTATPPAAVALWPTAVAAAETRMSASEFDAYTRGKTFYYGSIGKPYGGEEYLDGQRVRWSFLDGDCRDGRWYQEAELICFVYEDNPDPQCWTFSIGARGLIARFENDPAQSELYEVEQSDAPLLCTGPKIGV